MPYINLDINLYANDTYAFTIVNETNRELESILDGNLKVNPTLVNQPLHYIRKTKNLTGIMSLSGIRFSSWLNYTHNDLTLLYNDSALLSLPYILNELSNFYSNIEKLPLINTTLAAFPKITKYDENVFDKSSFSALIVLGIGLVMPAVSFATEIVHDREVCKNNFK